MARRWIVPAAVAVVLLAACGGTRQGKGIATLEGAELAGTDEPAAGAEIEVEEALLAFTSCMREEGIEMPDPELDAAGHVKLVQLITRGGLAAARALDPEAVREAGEACRYHLEGVAIQFARIDRSQLQDRLLEYAACMRDNGFDLPDPDFSSGGGGPGLATIFPGIGVEVFEEPAFQTANEECQGIFAGLLPAVGEQ